MTKLNWPYPRLTREAVLAISVALLALCLYPFWGTIALAAIFAFGLKQPLIKLRGKLHLGRGFTVALAVTLLVCSLIGPVSFLGLRLYQIALGHKEKGVSGIFSEQTSGQLTSAYNRVEGTIADYGKRFNMYDSTADARAAIQDNIASMGKGAVSLFTGALLSIPDLVVGLLIFALFFYLFLAKGGGLGESLVRLGIVPAGDLDPLVKTFQKSCYDTIVTNLVLGAIQASIVAVGARICGFKEMAVIFTITFFLSFIPIIGASPMAFLLALVSFLTANTSAGIALVVVGLIAGSIDNILRPFLISGGESEGHPIFSFAAIIGAIAIFGLKGLFVGPVILTTTFALLANVTRANDHS
jgi:predicted PurR-regulated permease PerM